MAKRLLRTILRGISLLAACVPAACSGFGKWEAPHQFFAQACALFPRLPGDYLRVAFYRLTLTECSLFLPYLLRVVLCPLGGKRRLRRIYRKLLRNWKSYYRRPNADRVGGSDSQWPTSTFPQYHRGHFQCGQGRFLYDHHRGGLLDWCIGHHHGGRWKPCHDRGWFRRLPTDSTGIGRGGQPGSGPPEIDNRSQRQHRLQPGCGAMNGTGLRVSVSLSPRQTKAVGLGCRAALECAFVKESTAA